VKTLKEAEKTIYKMRQVLHGMMDEKENLLDIEVINASQELDKALNEYNKLLTKIDK
jgi:uncharacterized protein YoxC